MHKVLVKRADPHSANYPGVITSLRNPTHTHTHLRVMVAVFLGLISPSCLCYFLDFPAVFMKERLLLPGPCLQTCRSHFELQINDRCRPPPCQGHRDYQRLRGETDGPPEDQHSPEQGLELKSPRGPFQNSQKSPNTLLLFIMESTLCTLHWSIIDIKHKKNIQGSHRATGDLTTVGQKPGGVRCWVSLLNVGLSIKLLHIIIFFF